jgi:hypothetical protein
MTVFSSWKYPHLRRFTPISSSEHIVTFAASHPQKSTPIIIFKPVKHKKKFFPNKSPFPFLAIRLFTVPFGRPLFPLQFPFCLSQVM